MSEQVNASNKEFTDTADGLNKIAELCAMDGRVSRGTIHIIENAAIKLQKAAALLDVFAHGYEAVKDENQKLRGKLKEAEHFNERVSEMCAEGEVEVVAIDAETKRSIAFAVARLSVDALTVAETPDDARILRGHIGRLAELAGIDPTSDHSGDATAAVAPVNRVLTLDEVLSLPEGARVWVEERECAMFASQTHTRIGNRLVEDAGRGWYDIKREWDRQQGETDIRVWSLPVAPTEEEKRENPWEVEG